MVLSLSIAKNLILTTLSVLLSLPSPSVIFQSAEEAAQALKTAHRQRASTVFSKSGSAIQIRSWKDLPSGQRLAGSDDALYFRFKIANGSRVHLLVLNLDSAVWELKPALNSGVETTTVTATKNGAGAAVNGGYFSMSDGKSVSYVVIDGKELASPRRNLGILYNPHLGAARERIYNRSELRILKDASGASSVRIAPHDAALVPGETLLHSIQAGPRLLPALTVEEEAFVRQESGKVVDVISSRQAVARTAFGISADRRHALLLCVEGGEEENQKSGLTLLQLRDLMADLGCVEALNLDGGGSTTMFAVLPDQSGKAVNNTVCKGQSERRVKSVLLLLPKTKELRTGKKK